MDIVRRVGGENIPVKKGGKHMTMPRVEATIRKVLEKALQPDAGPRDIANAMALYRGAKFLESAPSKARSGVLVVYPTMEQEAWAAATEGELLPKDPLHGIPGAEGLMLTKKKRGAIPDEDAA